MDDGERGNHTTQAGNDAFEHIITHDINNYLQIIQGNTDLLLAEVNDPDLIERLRTIRHQSVSANAMLETVGGVTRGGNQTSYESVDVGRLVSSEISRLKSAYPEATISADTEEVYVNADELLSSVFTNLCENALKHNDSSAPRVHVTIESSDGTVMISVEDNGPGLPDEVRDQLLGRGLAPPQSGVHIIRYLVERYGGRIDVNSCQDGTNVTVDLPRWKK